MKRKQISAMVSAALLSLTTGAALAEQGKISDDVVKIGVLTDMSGVYADFGGAGAVLAAKMAAEDFGGKVLGKPIEVINADHQNKPDIAKSITTQWFDRDQVDMTIENLNSGVALTVQDVGKDKNRITIVTGAASSALTEAKCAPATGIHYVYDTYSLANITGKLLVKQGFDTWYFLTADYAFGKQLEKDTTDTVKANGGKVLGSVLHPLSTTDYSSFLLQAQASKAKIIGLANAGLDTVNSIKAANEFGITKSQSLAALLLLITDVHALGLPTAQGLYLTEAWYWDQDNDSRAWAKRYFERQKKMPNSNQAGVYSATMHYLKAVQAAGTDDTAAVMKKMHDTPISDMFTKTGKLRDDGLMVHDMYLFQVKKPAESKAAWDYYKVVQKVPADQAFLALAQSTCPAVKKP
jgi:branched-chain amino acid transport system substrate-binding protein